MQSSATLTEGKKIDDLLFLNEVSSVPLQQALRHLRTAFTDFFAERAKYPAFKSRKKSRLSAEYTRSAFKYRGGQIALGKTNTPLNVVWSRPLPEGAEPSTVTVSKDAAGRWFVSILREDRIAPLPAAANVVGVDAGITALATLSAGEKITDPRHERADRRKLAKAQRTLARKRKGSANRARAKLAVARVAVSDAAWRQMREMLEYKAQRHGREPLVVDRWFPSSKPCSACGTIQRSMPLGIRDWVCTCGTVHDRDVNAAKNILAAGPADR